MPNDKKIDISENVMSLVRKGQAKMKPRWYFSLGTFAMAVSLTGLTVLSIFLVSLISFSLRSHGPMGAVRFQMLLSSFPWWAPLSAIAGFFVLFRMLKKYDFSYKHNFRILIAGIVIAFITLGILLDFTGLDRRMFRGTGMHRFYRNDAVYPMRGQGF